MTLKEIRDGFLTKIRRRERIEKVNLGIIGDQEIAQLMSEAQQELQRKLLIVESSTTVSLTSGIGDLPSNFGKIKAVRYGTEFLQEKSVGEVIEAMQHERSGEATIFGVYISGVTQKIYVFPTVDSVVVYYYPDTLFHQHTITSAQDWGTFDGDDFSGDLKIPDRYALAIQLWMVAQFFDSQMPKYIAEMRSLQSSTAKTISAPKYNLGGIEDEPDRELIRSQNASITTTASGSVYSQHYIVKVTEGSTTYEEQKSENFGTGVTPSLASNVLTLTSGGLFPLYNTFVECSNNDFTWTHDSVNQITITWIDNPGWAGSTVEVYVP